VLDNFERALNAHEDKEDTFYQGVSMVARQLEGILNDLGVHAMDLEVGTPFNPNFHNAVAHIEDGNLGQSVVAEILQKGYMHRDKVLRHSMVKVAN
jgi:molecular chaperone GrpE